MRPTFCRDPNRILMTLLSRSGSIVASWNTRPDGKTGILST
jgi:hypothetical protein